MTNPYPHPASYRRLNQALPSSSYATVAAAGGSQSSPARFGALSHLLHPEDDPPSRSNMSSIKPSPPQQPTDAWLYAHASENDSPPAAPPLFIRPSYLHNSRHVERLQAQHNLEAAAHNESRRHPQSNPPPAADLSSTTPATATVHRSRKSMNQNDHAERRNPVPNPTPKKLPTCWSETDKWPGLELSARGTEVKFTGSTKTGDEAASIRSDHPIPKEVGIYYFEVTILSRGKDG
jgi:hypothetical protein